MALDLHCTCGEELEVSIDRRFMRVEVTPCDKCLEASRTSGYEEGRKDFEE
jgi:hypothetical protein